MSKANIASLFANMTTIVATPKTRGRGAGGDVKPRLSFNPGNNGTQFNKKAQELFPVGQYGMAFDQKSGMLALKKVGESKTYRFLGTDQVFELAGGTENQVMKVELEIAEENPQGFACYGSVELKEKEVVPGRGRRKANEKVDEATA
jgi:hypothetical protein